MSTCLIQFFLIIIIIIIITHCSLVNNQCMVLTTTFVFTYYNNVLLIPICVGGLVINNVGKVDELLYKCQAYNYVLRQTSGGSYHRLIVERGKYLLTYLLTYFFTPITTSSTIRTHFRRFLSIVLARV